MDDFEQGFSNPQIGGYWQGNDPMQYRNYADGLSREQLSQGQGGNQSIWWRPENSDGNYVPVSRDFINSMLYNKARGVNYYGDPGASYPGNSVDDGVFRGGQQDAFEQAGYKPLPAGMQEPKFDMSNGGKGTPVKSDWNDEDGQGDGVMGFGNIPGVDPGYVPVSGNPFDRSPHNPFGSYRIPATESGKQAQKNAAENAQWDRLDQQFASEGEAPPIQTAKQMRGDQQYGYGAYQGGSQKGPVVDPLTGMVVGDYAHRSFRKPQRVQDAGPQMWQDGNYRGSDWQKYAEPAKSASVSGRSGGEMLSGGLSERPLTLDSIDSLDRMNPGLSDADVAQRLATLLGAYGDNEGVSAEEMAQRIKHKFYGTQDPVWKERPDWYYPERQQKHSWRIYGGDR